MAAKTRKPRRKKAAVEVHYRRPKHAVIYLDEFFNICMAIRDEMERETLDLMSQTPRPGDVDDRPVRQAAHTIWDNLCKAFKTNEGAQDFARHTDRMIGQYDIGKARLETDRVEQDRRIAAWEK